MAKLERSASKAQTNSVEVEVQHPTKYTNEKRPSLLGFFSVRTKGVPIFGKVTLTEPEKDKYNIMFPSKKGKDGDIDKVTKKQKYYNYVYPISTETRSSLLNATLTGFEDFVKRIEDKGLNVDKKEDLEAIREISSEFNQTYDGVTIKYPILKENFPSQIGDASFSTELEIVMKDLELHQKADGTYFVNYPSKAGGKDPASGEIKYYPCCGPMSTEAAEEIKVAAIKAFEELK